MTRSCASTVPIALIAILTALPAQAAGQCADHEMVVRTLADRYGETRQSAGVAPNSTMMEVYASTETGTWTIVVTLPNGMTCLVASGDQFEAVAEAQGKPGEDA